ncbi:MAG: F0F1 ATP synthase subunit gamma [Corynebacteriales bacterium]|nr:F0F1 ATP synthase subunit gamma [Mycobacteriales bacterium]
MGAQLRVLRRRIKTVQATKKITKAMELIATSRIAKAQQRVAAATPYTAEITKVLTTLASTSDVEHPLLQPRPKVRRAGVLVVTADRGLAGGYNANVLRVANELMAKLKHEGTAPLLYVIGRKGVGYYKFRNRAIEESWTGFSEQPSYEDARKVGTALVPRFLNGADDLEHEDGTHHPGEDGVLGVDEVYLVYTRFQSMVSQVPMVRRFAPLEVVEEPLSEHHLPAYEFEPDVESMLDDLLPRYMNTRIYAALLESAASESAARRAAMKSATDNAQEMIRNLSRIANQARQAEITQEISEIVGGSDALAATGSEN